MFLASFNENLAVALCC